jgi:hypothetical protein
VRGTVAYFAIMYHVTAIKHEHFCIDTLLYPASLVVVSRLGLVGLLRSIDKSELIYNDDLFGVHPIRFKMGFAVA